ncbi:MAG: phosphonate C-P lyase system protein PhnH [Pseudomonadota bacterium]|nr:phosphonate C-P lyase system protein PhnH [Pseudomonadota bacterium]
MIAESPVLEGGFADPVFDSQALFRILMDAMARPATIFALEARVCPPDPLSPVAAAIACTLADPDTPLWLGAKLATRDAIRQWLAFQTGAPLAANASDAEFAFIADPLVMPSLDAFAQGSQDYPDRSTTLVLQVESLDGGESLVFEGPGMRARKAIAPAPMPHHFARQWRANRERFPRGVDLVLTGPDSIACLPRTARLVEGEG